MATVVIDNDNPAAVSAEEHGQTPKPVETEAKTEVKTDVKADVKTEIPVAQSPADDEAEDENGLTEAQRKELSAKMLAAIGKKHRQMKEAEEFAAEQYNEKRLAEQRAENLERELRRFKEQTPVKALDPDEGKPKRENFQTEDAFRDAVDDWRVEKKFREREAQVNAEREQARLQEVARVAGERIAAARELVPDFVEVTESVDTPVPPYIAGYMQESDMFAELGYHFAKNPKELERLRQMRPDRALVEIGKIESKLSPFAPAKVENGNGSDHSKSTNGATPSTDAQAASSKTDDGQSRSRAAVIKPLSSGSAVQVEKAEADQTPQEALAAWQKKRGVNLVGRKRH
jgi:hypothetical protein